MSHLTVLAMVLALGACNGESAPPNNAATPRPLSTAPAESASEAPLSSAAPTPPDPVPTSCQRAGECTLSTFAGCCACCPGLPHAFLRAALARDEARCASAHCPPCSTPCGAEPAMSGYVAECVNRSCVAVPQ